MIYRLDGFVIVPPTNQWDDRGLVVPEMSYSSFAKTATEAWCRHIRTHLHDPDWSKKVQHWHDRGYRLKNATLTIEE